MDYIYFYTRFQVVMEDTNVNLEIFVWLELVKIIIILVTIIITPPRLD